MAELNISARGYNKILKVGRTIAGLDHSQDVRLEHLSEAVQYINLDRNLWIYKKCNSSRPTYPNDSFRQAKSLYAPIREPHGHRFS